MANNIYGKGFVAEQDLGLSLAQGYGYNYGKGMVHASRHSSEDPLASIRSMNPPFPVPTESDWGRDVVIDRTLLPPDWQVPGTGGTLYDYLQRSDPSQAAMFRRAGASQYREDIWQSVCAAVCKSTDKPTTTVRAVVDALSKISF